MQDSGCPDPGSDNVPLKGNPDYFDMTSCEAVVNGEYLGCLVGTGILSINFVHICG